MDGQMKEKADSDLAGMAIDVDTCLNLLFHRLRMTPEEADFLRDAISFLVAAADRLAAGSGRPNSLCNADVWERLMQTSEKLDHALPWIPDGLGFLWLLAERDRPARERHGVLPCKPNGRPALSARRTRRTPPL
jgi:hypothetical protein